MLDRGLVRGRAVGSPAASQRGFIIRTAGAQLPDLIQINCQNRVRGVFRISSTGPDGYLFFDDGVVAYAELGDASGIDAVATMLSLPGGSIEPCVREWPDGERLDLGADALLLRAAQRLDESARDRAAAPEVTTRVVRRVRQSADDAAHPQGVQETSEIFATPAAERAEQRRHLAELGVVQLADDGRVLLRKRGADAELADTTFFIHGVGGLVADTLGRGECRAAHLYNAEVGLVVFKGKTIVGVRGAPSALRYVLEKAGLSPSDEASSAPQGERTSGIRYAEVHAERPSAVTEAALAGARADLGALLHVKGVLGAWVSSDDGRVLGGAVPADVSELALEVGAARLSNLLRTGDESLGRAAGCELRFSEQRLIVKRFDLGLLSVLTREAPDQGLLRVALRMAIRRLEERSRSLLQYSGGER